MLVLANQTLAEQALLAELRDVPAGTDARIHVVVPANPVDTGQEFDVPVHHVVVGAGAVR